MKKTLVIMAAGLGSRYGGIKQMEGVGPKGEILMEYSIHDALRAGFEKVVFIIKPEMREAVEELCGRYVSKQTEVAYAYQERQELPGGYICPADRTKPWGTGHALLACRGLLNGPFVVLNADDYYGKSAFRHMLSWLQALPAGSEGAYCMAGFRLGNTLSDYGGVTRGICRIDGAGTLRQVTETRNIIKTPEGGAVKIGTLLRPVDVDACVSMNMWGFTPDILPRLESRFCTFLKDYRLEPKSEFLLPEVVDQLLADNEVSVKVLPTEDAWFGMTYQEDVPSVTEAFHKMAEQGIYKPGLY